MLFNSYIFWLFFIVVIVLYRFMSHRLQNRMLLVASYVFYGYWDWRFLSLIAISTCVDYFVAIKMTEKESKVLKKRYLLISVMTNLGLLGVFKYYDFFVTEFIKMFSNLGIDLGINTLQIILPVGISFYTFQTMSYTIDIYRGEGKPTKKFLDFALYVGFFPQLVAGPIERSTRLLPQILKPRKLDSESFSQGLYHVLIGMFKKVVIADNMAPIVNYIFARDPSQLTGWEVIVGVYAFSFQIYGDFSGYSSIAQGIAKWMGFDLMWNFKMPYFSVSPSDFWRRWHISLSSWLRDYLYIPLGGNRGSNYKLYRNLILTMLLGGLWHGAGWTFVAWGLYHGIILILYRLYEQYKGQLEAGFKKTNLSKIFQVVLMFHLVCISWLFFRAESINQVWIMITRIISDLSITSMALYGFGVLSFFVLPLLLLEIWIEKKADLLAVVNGNWPLRSLIYVYFSLMLIIFPPLTPQQFIYFQF